jgi:alpha-L-fucosidase 2
MTGAGTYPNLFCSHPPFQIDGNLGATAAIAEMLLQSTGNEGIISLLPALPAAPEWRSGKATGLRAKNDFEIDIEWKEGRVTKAVIYSKSGLNCHLQLKEGWQVFDAAGKKIKTEAGEHNVMRFSTAKGKKYIVK